MDFLWDAITEWLKELLVGGITSNLSGMFDSVNQKVAEISGQVGMTPQGWNGSIYNMIHNLSETVIVPIAGVILAFVMTLELIQIITDKNNFHEIETAVFFKWIFKTACAILIVTNTWNIVMGVFDVAQGVVNQASGVIISDASIDISSVVTDMESRLMEMELGPLFGLWFQSLFVGITMWALTICIFIVIYGRMVEIYLVTSVAPIPMAAMMGREWGGMGQNYLRSLMALGFQAFLIIVCVGIYAVLVENIALDDDIIGAIWSIRCCCVLPCSKLEASPRVFSRRTKSGGRFLNGLCTSTKRPDQSKNEGHVQSHQEAACLLRERGASRRAAFLSAQRACGDQHSGHVHGHPHAAVFPAGDVREERPAAGKDTPQHDPGVFPAAPAAAL